VTTEAEPRLDDAAKSPILDSLLGTLADRVLSDASGANIPPGTRLAAQPQRNLWLGMLASEHELADLPAFIGERRVPAAHGFTFRVAALPVRLDVTVTAALYLPVLPTHIEQQQASSDPLDRSTEDGDGSPVGGPGPVGTAANIPLTERTTKVTAPPVTVGITVEEGLRRHGQHELAEALQRAVRHAHRTAALGLFRPPRRRTAPRPDTSDTASDAAWRRYLNASLVSPGDYTLPEYSAAIEIEARRHPRYAEVTVTLVNTTAATTQQYADTAQTVQWPANRLDTHIYEAQLTAETDADVLPVDLEQVRESYRYNRDVLLFGEATAAEIDPSEPVGGRTRMRTCYGAEAPTSRVFPRATSLTGKTLDTSFIRLISDPLGALSDLADAADEWVEANWSARNLDRLGQRRIWDADARAQAEADADAARQEVDWVRAGVKELAADEELLEAFRQAMRTLQVIGARKNYSALYLFQAAWIVGCLPAVKDPSSDLNVDILWFATGGGKSEAYLGLMLVTLFYARRTGTTAGTLVWARFPLRLLSLQQTERFGEVLAVAEQIRLADPLTAAGEPFAVGYFVGSGNTPNKFAGRNSPFATADPTSQQVQEGCRVLDYCTTCRGLGVAGARDLQIAAGAARAKSAATFSMLRDAQPQPGGERRLEMNFDEPGWTMQHVCTSPGCPAAGSLDVFVVDDDIYRRTPSVLVGTVDKLAQLGMQKQFATLLGRAASRCAQHGFTADPQWCAVFGCQTRPSDRQPAKSGLGGLRLEIADEMHLLDEELGALDGLYETLLGAINEAMKNPPLRIVGATATLEGYREQSRHLYQRPGRRFPVNGPTVGENFWAYTDPERPLRRYLGLRPRRIAYTTATIETALTHRRWLEDLAARPEALLVEAGLPTDATHLAVAREAAMDLYEVFLAYALRNDDLGQFLREERLRDFHALGNWAQVNGDADPARIRDDVRRLVNPASYPPDQQIKTIVATKAIGHGFDVGRLGVIVMMGTPTQASEVIQASARVGRQHPGLVINIANPTRDRDVSTHRYYKYWIAYLDRLIHKVPINRESLPALRRVLSGGLMAWLLQFYDRGWVTGGARRRSLADSDMLRDALNGGHLTPAGLTEALQAGFGLNPHNAYHELHRQTVRQWVDETTRLIAAQGSSKRKTNDMLDPRVPRSLRDVEEPIVIYYES
jgi:Lhr-like helicase